MASMEAAFDIVAATRKERVRGIVSGARTRFRRLNDQNSARPHTRTTRQKIFERLNAACLRHDEKIALARRVTYWAHVTHLAVSVSREPKESREPRGACHSHDTVFVDAGRTQDFAERGSTFRYRNTAWVAHENRTPSALPILGRRRVATISGLPIKPRYLSKTGVRKGFVKQGVQGGASQTFSGRPDAVEGPAEPLSSCLTLPFLIWLRCLPADSRKRTPPTSALSHLRSKRLGCAKP